MEPIKVFTRWLVKVFLKDSEDLEDQRTRERYGLLGGWFSIILNTVLFLVKLVVGIIANSLALVADAVHSLSDSATSVVVIVGFKISSKPPDQEHPYGHGRAEYIATLIISVLLMVTGIEFIRSSIQQITEPEAVYSRLWVLGVVLLTIILKEVMGRISHYLGVLIKSDVLEADAWHHRTDALSSALVLVSLAGGMIGIPSLDGYGGLGVAGILLYTGYRIAHNAIDTLLGRPPKKETVDRIRSLARSVDNVIDAHDITVHSYGHHRYINLHIEVDEREAPLTLHDAAEKVESLLRHELKAYALVHLDPISLESTEAGQLRKIMDEICDQDSRINGYHELRVIRRNGEPLAVMDIMLEPGISDDQGDKALEWLERELRKQYPNMDFEFRVTPIHRYK